MKSLSATNWKSEIQTVERFSLFFHAKEVVGRLLQKGEGSLFIDLAEKKRAATRRLHRIYKYIKKIGEDRDKADAISHLFTCSIGRR
jgi:hypothetical protein